MKKTTIERLAYTIKRARKNNQPMPIFFLGAGASATGRIPLASGIVDSILKNHSENPDVEILKDKTYSKLMDCLDTSDRDVLLKGYIDKAKINVTHIYLAQLMEKGYVDYVLTTNFDNLMIRALALFNEFPPVHDMAILKDLTTTTFAEKSIIHLHGKYDGAWMLNTDEELDKVGETVPNIFNKIANKRPWVFIGYSGDDPILDH
ncbi:MAG: SIR2 family protein, partial [Flavobacteriaceae bacterium]|nr:SIR2 family protein [Flavobacteriaceae bacterium]